MGFIHFSISVSPSIFLSTYRSSSHSFSLYLSLSRPLPLPLSHATSPPPPPTLSLHLSVAQLDVVGFNVVKKFIYAVETRGNELRLGCLQASQVSSTTVL